MNKLAEDLEAEFIVFSRTQDVLVPKLIDVFGRGEPLASVEVTDSEIFSIF